MPRTADDVEMVEIACTILEIRERSIKIIDGTTKEFTNKETGEITERPVWFFIPRILIQNIEALKVGETTEIIIPERFAEEKGLI
jgi:hypothetical protein